MLEKPETPLRKLGVIVLAAGLARRMGGPNKLLQPYRGKPLLAHALTAAAGDIDFMDRIAVTGRDCAEIEALAASHSFRSIYNPRFEDGLGTSIAAGAGALHPDICGVFISLGDMPEIHADDYIGPGSRFKHGSIVVPVHRGARGHPVLFCGSYLRELSALSGDEGARSILKRHAARIIEVETPNPGVLRDVDTHEDFDRTGLWT